MNRRRFLMLTACAFAPRAALAAPQNWQGRAMGADITLQLHGAGPEQARSFFAEVARDLSHVESLFSLHQDSDLTRLNRIGRLRFPAEGMLELLALGDRLHRATGGVFDPTVQPLWLARAGGGDEAAARDLAGWAAVDWSEDEIRLPRPGMALTFNGIAQGWAADRLAATATRHDLTDLMIDSGEIRTLGPRDWPAGIADAEGRVQRRISLRQRALATSSPLGTRIGPRALPHILAADGRAPLWDTLSVSAPDAALADGLSTALCLLDQNGVAAALAAFPEARIELALPVAAPIASPIRPRA